MRILITGGSGFLGQAMSRALTWRGDDVIIDAETARALNISVGDQVTYVGRS